jgi:hypothetical protein
MQAERRAMLAVTHGRRHVDDFFDELGFFQVWYCFIATLELGACQPIAVFQRWHHASRVCMDVEVVVESAMPFSRSKLSSGWPRQTPEKY